MVFLGDSWIVDEEEVVAFRRDGYLISPPILPAILLDRAWQAIVAKLANGRGREIDPLALWSDRVGEEGNEQLGYLCLQLPEVAALARHPAVCRTAAMLADSQGVRLFHDRLIIKPANGKADTTVGWHTDRAYWRSCSARHMLTAWIPFDDVATRSGTLQVMRGSHRWGGNPHMATAHVANFAQTERLVRSRGAALRPGAMVMRRGQVSFHHCDAVHGSGPNFGRRPRVALAVHFQPVENAYRARVRGKRPVHTNDLICRKLADGRPDYSDPAVFPQLWPPPG